MTAAQRTPDQRSLDLPATVSADEADAIRHALGITTPGKGHGWRNSYNADPGSADAALWGGLVDRGLARIAAWPDDISPGIIYTVTRQGLDAVGVVRR
jgi:hypothetical protein